MAGKNHIIFLGFFCLLVCSCGQVGTITGGPVDTAAPKPISDKIDPPMGSKNVSPATITIPFDEFITLNKPSENIRVVPADVSLEAKIKNRTLILSKTAGEWEKNTTYAVYMNGAVRDITENNDSLMVFVFSTGNTLDSLQTFVQVVDAFTNKPLENVTVGLYENPLKHDTSTVEPRYLSLTDETGLASFNYLKKGPFHVYAFDDKNKNGALDQQENRGTLNSTVVGDTGSSTVPIIRIMPPAPSAKIKVESNEIIPPANWCLGFNKRVEDTAAFYFSGPEPIAYEWSEFNDSVTYYFLNKNSSGDYTVIFQGNENADTITKKFFFKTVYSYSYNTNLKNSVLQYSDTLLISLPEPILEINENLISGVYRSKNDSVPKPLSYSVERVGLRTMRIIHDKSPESAEFQFLPGSLNGYNYSQKDTFELSYSIQKKNEVGNIFVRFDSIPPNGILYLTDSRDTIVSKAAISGTQTEVETEFLHIQPGQYKFYYVIDENQDGRWSTGNIFQEVWPERVVWYTEPTTVRPNWDVQVNLTKIEGLIKN
ncbi:MAG: Ig-like domain-containing protein [Brumimicrobium sp.]|nr:Ig-like domain-containing protein [Brumimicrobium sp.]